MRPCAGDIYATYGFLFLPKTIQGETRWLTFAAWEECYYYGFLSSGRTTIYTKWLNPPEKNKRKQCIAACEMYVEGDIEYHHQNDVEHIPTKDCNKIKQRQQLFGH
jgi:hypothetical protein